MWLCRIIGHKTHMSGLNTVKFFSYCLRCLEPIPKEKS